ncbi:MAG: HAD-IC family P-type ATPase [Candidatus Staskawiczbacteria bacterium]|nr:HAD-IC family P-type ATPase [Candidatus Staskawiczbacteria bacterium]
MQFSEFTTKNIPDSLRALDTTKDGLSKKEVILRQKKYGLNEIKSKSINILEVFFRQLKSPFTYLLIVAALISFFVGEKTDFFVIIAVVGLNIIIGFLQEYRAEKAIFLLRKFVSQGVKVLRQGKEELVDKKEIVPGDVVILEAGDRVPADLRIISVQNFLVDESALTGESVPTAKNFEALKKDTEEIFKAKNILFSGTSIISGKAQAVVINTGKDTAFGQIAQMVSTGARESAYEKGIIYFCKLVLKIVVVTILLMFAGNLLIKGLNNFFELLLFSVALIVSILPEALPAVVTFSLSRGSLEMAKRHVVVRRLTAIEDLGNIEVLCTDKTGTLTENKLSLEKIVSFDKRKCLLYGLLSSDLSDHKESILNPFDLALFEKSPENFWQEYKKYETISEFTFDSCRMRSSYIIQDNKGNKFLIVKGAPEILLNLCVKSIDGPGKKEIKEDAQREGREGRRVLGIAYKKLSITKGEITEEDEKGLSFLGYFVFEDPLKKSTTEAISLAKKLGVKIKVITGDSKEVAGYVAHKMKLISNPEDVFSADELEKMTAEEFDDACNDKQVFARISPQLKYKIVKSLQKRYDVGFLGEGINDAPALKIANVAIVVQSASDVSREVSDVVLLKKDLKVIIEGIKSGRQIYSNINKYIKCMLASNFGNFYSVAVISLFINYLPMLPVQILLGNLLSDLPLISIATDSVDIEELKKPKMYQLSSVLPLIMMLALVSTVFDFIFFTIFYKYSPANIQTLWFIESILSELLLIFIIRTRHVAWKAKMPSFPLIVLAIIDAIFIVVLPFLPIGQKIFHFVVPSFLPLLIVFGLLGAYSALSEITKLLYFKYFSKTPKTDFAIETRD